MTWPAAWNGTLAELAACAESPTSDGILLDWVRRQNPTLDDVPAIVALLTSTDPHLQEAGVRLASALLALATMHVPAGVASLETALASMVRPSVDPWVLEALAELLEHDPLPAVIEAVARRHIHALAPTPPLPPTPPSPPRASSSARDILRNRLPEPWRRLEYLYERLALAAGDTPSARDLAYLPVLEHRHGTHGWEATLRALRQRQIR